VQQTAVHQTLLRYWLPVAAWMLLIFVASTDLMSAQHTSRFIGPFLRWLNPEISLEGIRAVQFAVRKAAHVTEYAILAALLLRALHAGLRPLRVRHAFVAFAIAVAYAAVDEYHQSFVASRTGSPRDVLIDASGALLGVAICSWLIARRRPPLVASTTAAAR
jgi:VanZ family protein